MNKQTVVDALFRITMSLPTIRAALGERWPAFSNNLRVHAALFESPKDELALVAAVDRLIDTFRREERAYTIFLDSGPFEADDRGERGTLEEIPIAVIADRYRQACANPDAFVPPPPHLNAGFEGIASDQPLPVGQPVPLIVSVGTLGADGSSVPFSFTFDDAATPVAFTVYVHADTVAWTIEVAEPTMIVAPPGVTQQAARFLVTARQPAADKLYLKVERADTGAAVQYVWLPVTAVPDDQPAGAGWRASLPFDSRDTRHHAVEISIEERDDGGSFLAVVHADLTDGIRVRHTYVVPIDAAELRRHTYRLRHALETIIVYTEDDGKSYPFANFKELTAEEVVQRCAVLRRAAIPLADAGQQVWCHLFGGSRVPEGLKQLASALRELPHGSTIRVTVQSRQFILPWALLYDKPGEISEETIDWSGFWGYRYILDVLPPGTYQAPVIGCPPGIQVLLSDDDVLRKFTGYQEQFIHNQLGAARSEICWGTKATWQALKMPSDAGIIYCYCHGTRPNSMEWPGPLPGDAMLIFGARDKGIRLADLERLELGALWNHPLVFLNACEAAPPGGVFYEGFMSFFIENRGARAFIGAEVDIPQSLAHHFALRFLQAFAEGLPVGEILWRLRRYYLDDQCTILAFNYSLYGLDELRLEQPIV